MGHSSHDHYDGPAFSSSALYDIATHGKNAPNNNNEIAMNSLNIFSNNTKNISLNKSNNFLGSSFMGMPKDDIRDRMDDQEICSSLVLHLKEGQSEENIIIQEGDGEGENGNLPHRSIINLQRGISNISNTEKYWMQDGDDKI